MYYVYLLKSIKDLKLYIGYTKDVDARFEKHNSGRIRSTKHRRPLKLVYFEAYQTKMEAKERERRLKHYGKTYAQLKERIKKRIDSA